MNCLELLEFLHKGEDSSQQFKENFDSINKLAVEISAFANSNGGIIFIGVDNEGNLIGLEKNDIERLNGWISNATSQKIDPPIFVKTEILICNDKRIMILTIPRGTNKPYAFNKTEFWVKNAGDKRRASREELFRLLQSSKMVYSDEMETDAVFDDLDVNYFVKYYASAYDEKIEFSEIPQKGLLENLRLFKKNHLTLAGLLLFGKNPERIKPQFNIKATYYDGNDVSVSKFIDSEEINGKIIDEFQKGIVFIERNLRRVQRDNNFNAPGELEIPKEAFSEILANALIHRDYFINSSVYINLFLDRLEIVSPGLLPNTLNEENIKLGIHIARNPILLSVLEKEKKFSYKGRGSGIPRVIRLCNEAKINITLVNDVSRQQFKVIFARNVPTLKS